MSRRRTQPTPYKITRFEYLKQTIAALTDDRSRPWSDYPCLEWPYARMPHGYGTVSVAKGQTMAAHRLSLQLSSPDISLAGLDACHHCDNRICFRPVHLFAAPRQGNVDDMMSKGRYGIRILPSGEAHPHAKLTWDLVYQIHAMRNSGLSQDKIAKRLTISQNSIGSVLRGETWKTPLIPVAIGTRARRSVKAPWA